MVKSHQKPAVVDLMKGLAKRRTFGATVLEQSKAYDSKSNGRAENAVRRVEEQVRTMKLALEASIGEELDVHHPVFAWLVEHAADILVKCAVGRDGRTPFERIKGKRYHGLMLEFGCSVRVKYQGKLQGGLLKERWGNGVWFGKKWASDEHLVSMGNGKIVRARDVRPMPEDQAFDRGMLLGIRGAPCNPSAAGHIEDGQLPEIPRAPIPRPEQPVAPPVARRVMIHKSYLERFGFTYGRKRCEAMRIGEVGIQGGQHSEACRRRIENCMETDAELKVRLDAARERQDRYLAEEVARGDRSGPAQAPEVVEEVLEPEDAPGLAEVEEDEEQIPDIGDGLDEDEEQIADIFGDFDEDEPEVKHARVESEVSEHQSEGGDSQPAAKRARAESVSAVFDPHAKHVTWADLADEEDELLGVPVDSLLCDHCDRKFASRNALYVHIREVGRAPAKHRAELAEKGAFKKTQQMGPDSENVRKPK